MGPSLSLARACAFSVETRSVRRAEIFDGQEKNRGEIINYCTSSTMPMSQNRHRTTTKEKMQLDRTQKRSTGASVIEELVLHHAGVPGYIFGKLGSNLRLL